LDAVIGRRTVEPHLGRQGINTVRNRFAILVEATLGLAMVRFVRRRSAALASTALLALAVPATAHALAFNVTFEASVSGAPAGFLTAFNTAIATFTSAYTDPITINLDVGWNEIDGTALQPGNLGQSLTLQTTTLSYAQVRARLVGDSTSAFDATGLALLPVADPTSGKLFRFSRAEGKALGLIAGNSPQTDGFVGFNGSASYSFDPNNRAVPGQYDFIGLAEHEVSEVMGRYGMVQNGLASGLGPIDLFRYTAPGARDFTPVNGSYFSIDGGATVINTFNGTGGGDISDWAGLTPDAFNAFGNTNRLAAFSPGDVILMDAIGYDSVPEPTPLALVGISLSGLALTRRRASSPR
jgi:hypothetical protein